MEALAERMDAALRAGGVDTSQPIPAGDEAVAAPTSGCAPAAEVPTEEQRRADELARAERNTGRADKLTSHFELKRVKSLSEVREKGHVLAEEDYKRELKEQQERLSALTLEMYRHRVPLVIAYEGWDAAGKGGNIKRVTAAMDARDYKVWPIGGALQRRAGPPVSLEVLDQAAPERPRGRSSTARWYGRVLVERIEGFATQDEWRRAFDEINEFEDDLRIWGAVLVKFWVARVTRGAAATVPRPRERPRAAVGRSPPRTGATARRTTCTTAASTTCCGSPRPSMPPGTCIHSDDKRYARVKALKVINGALEKRLKV